MTASHHGRPARVPAVEPMSRDPERNDNLTSALAALRIDRPANVARSRGLTAFSVSVLLAGAAAGVLIARSRGASREADAPVRAAAAPPPGRSSAAVLTASGYVVARRKAIVSAKIQGRLAALSVDEGSPVRAGEVIARLDNGDLVAQIGVARAQLQRAEADVAEQQRQLQLADKLASSGAVSADQVQADVSRLRVAEAALSQSRANVSLSEANFQNSLIRAPFDGIVVRKMAEVGESVAPIPPGVNLSTSSGAIVAMADLSSLEVEVDVGEGNIARLHRGQPAEVSVDAFTDRVHHGVVREITPTADRTRATVTVKVTILEPDRDLRPEMSAKVTFIEAKESDVRK